MIAEQLTHFKPFALVLLAYIFTNTLGWAIDDYGQVARLIKEFAGALAMLITLTYGVIKVVKDFSRWKRG